MLTRYGSSIRDVMFGTDAPEEMYAYGDNDELWGDGGTDLLHGGDGDDKLVGGAGADLLDGGGGSDTASYEDGKQGVYVRLDTGAGYTGFAAGDILIGIEHLRGSSFADILVGNEEYNRIEGGGGDDLLFGQGGIDVLVGGTGNDHLWGGADWDYQHGDAGYDYVRYDFAPSRVDVRLQQPVITGTGGGWAGEALGDSYWDIEGVVGSNFDDHIEGNDPNPGTGVIGNNILIGLDGNDEILGLGGDDDLWGGNGADLLDGGTGFDFARYDDSPEAVYVNLQDGFGYTGAALNDRLVSIEGLWGSSYGDTLIGDANVNTFYGGDGDDLLIGGMGGDRLAGDAGFDTVSYAGAASSVAVNLVTGGTAGDAAGDLFFSIESVIGSNYADTLVGNSEDNTLRGGAGGDNLTGGAGNDRFVFARTDLLAERDIITDFGTAAGNIDTLVFRDLAAGDIALTDDPAAGGVRISVLDPAYGGDIIVTGVTSAELSGHLLFM